MQHGETMSHYLYKAVIKLGLSPIDVRRDFSFSHMRKEVNEHVASGDRGVVLRRLPIIFELIAVDEKGPCPRFSRDV